MGIFSFLSKKTKTSDTSNSELPWKDNLSIYAHIAQNIDSSGRLYEAGKTLPDDERRFKPGEIRWVAGGMDGAFGHHGGGGGNESMAKHVADLVNTVARTGDLRKKAELYTILINDMLLNFIDPALEGIIGHKPPIEPHLRAFARWLLTESPDRGPLKFGIALLGLMSDESSIEDIVLVGKHEEFTLFSAVAVTSILENPEPILWEMAKSVDGWGRIQLVERLSETKDANIKDWLLREGYKNTVMYEYLAYTCAVTGELHSVLAAESIDAEMVTSAGELITALIAGGPAESIDDYVHAANVIRDYLQHLEPQARQLEHLIIADTIHYFLTEPDEEWKTRTENGWSTVERHKLDEIAQRIIAKPFWLGMVESNRNTEDTNLFWNIKRAARILHIDIRDTFWMRLQAFPMDSGRWDDVMEHIDAKRIDEAIQLAQTKLPIKEIATGPADEHGLGKEYAAHSCLDAILQNLGRFPGHGSELIKAGLQSPVVRNRHMALRALESWGEEHWPEDMRTFLKEAQQRDPHKNVKASIQKILSGQSLQ